ncbi:DUF6086 family protein, partial [Streptomyces sp. MCAF7]
MSCFFQIEGKDVWNPSNFVAQLFIEEARALARSMGLESGIGDIVDDECELSTAEFLAFTAALTKRHWNTNNPTLKDLLSAVTGINCVLLDRAGQGLVT